MSFARSTAYDDEPPRLERGRAWNDYGGGEVDGAGTPGYGDDDDDDDAFTAVATGVATDLDMDDSPARRTDDPRARLAAAQQQQAQQFLAIPRPPSRGVQVRRASPV